ncbi:MAG TPA: DNA polymerase III subunit gamma/tau [Myxococcota bacterium]
MVLARKWRPRTFDEVDGQAHVTRPLRNAVRTGRIPHALLLTGPRGTGKTTLARIFACCLNNSKGPSESFDPDDPDCVAIQSGHSTDVQEIDAASRTGVDDVRDIIESIRYAPSPGKHRIYVVDEVHMLSTAAFNALLKTLEEPPPRSLFVFCTTNPEKIPFTVLSRCQRYDLRRIATSEVAANLRRIAKAEGIQISDASLAAIARAGEGSLRDSQTLLDQLLAYGGTNVDDAQVAEVLDLVDRRLLLAIASACIDGDAAAALTAIRRAWDRGIDAKRLGGELLATLRDLVVLRVAPRAGLVEGGEADVAALAELAARAEEARLRRMFRALLREQEDLAWAPDPFAVLEVALVRLASMPSGDDVDALLTRIDALEKRLRGETPETGGAAGGGASPRSGVAPTARGSSDVRAATQDASAAPLAPGPAPGPAPAREEPAALSPEPQSAERDEEPPLLEDAPPEAFASFEASAPRANAPAPLTQVFDRLRAFAQQENRGLFAALEGGRLLAKSDAALRVALPSAIASRRLESRKADLESVIARFFGKPLRVELVVDAGGASAASGARAAGGELARKRRQEALAHPAVNTALEILGAEIDEIRPLGGAS